MTDLGTDACQFDRRVLVYRIGSLGDTLVALPALWRVRTALPDAHITLLCDRQVGRGYVLASDLLAGSGLVDDYSHYPVGGSRWRNAWDKVRLVARLRRGRFDTLVYLAPSDRPTAAIRRDDLYFRVAGIPRRIGLVPMAPPPRASGCPLPPSEREADLLERRLDGTFPRNGRRYDLGLGPSDQASVDVWLAGQPADGGRTWVGVAAGSKMPAKVWPADRYATVVAELIDRFDVWPVVFGDAGDRPLAERLVAGWGRGAVAAGLLGLRAAAAALGRCRLYLGNDTGTMHLAASAGTTCVAVFCSHAPKGQWYPLGDQHRVFRTDIDCEGCWRQVCVDRGMECILRVGPAEVLTACADVLANRNPLPLVGLGAE